MFDQQEKVTFIGGGNMARSIIGGLIKRGYPAHLITVTAPTDRTRQRMADDFGVNTAEDNAKGAKEADVVVLAVKPQLLDIVCERLVADMGGHGDKLYLSIAAGVTVDTLQAYLSGAPRIVRTMPNTPSLLGLGMTGLYAPAGTKQDDKLFSQSLMAAVGKVVWVEEEAGINHVIAAAGSAPAYFFLFMEAIQTEAENMGFDAETARLLVQQTAQGAAQMVTESDLPISTLRSQVTSKGGTTAEALRTFEEGELSTLVAKAMRAAVARAEDMAKQF
ncbi:pyrroline-5-carboxylate reductase [Corallincola spongiicola]|uniref:Pyrroline-5-carboxylate reductase n=1 Tax=Corallincola spongiicola TaxID=2520508 RepID=A0ABY1WLJ6_9GAMM|nr:pyrroline-5-carboxylate reductase [Corallincola spongiicola]TAA41773.1 pyrroline-5-carboxylate reductase [Corallincola spongiicola]